MRVRGRVIQDLWEVALMGLLLLGGCQSPHIATQGDSAGRSADPVSESMRIAIDRFANAKPKDSYVQGWQAAIRQLALSGHSQVYPVLTDLIGSSRFSELTPSQQHAALMLVGSLAIEQHHATYAQGLLARSTAMPQAGVVDWHARYTAAAALGDSNDALVSVTAMLSRWPTEATTLSPETLRQLVYHEPDNDAQRDVRLRALNVLFDVSYKFEDGVEPEPFWDMLVGDLVERREIDRAALVVTRISSPYAILSMRVDRRFDALVQKNPRRFDVKAAAERLVAELERAVKSHPRSLDAVTQLTYAYLYAGRYADVLRMTDAVIAAITAAGGVRVLYDDADPLHWIYENRATALEATHRWDEAEVERRLSAGRSENGQANVSNVIDLAEFYADRDRGQDAFAALRELPNETDALSPYGKMAVHLVRLKAALSTHEEQEVQSCLTYLRENKLHAIAIFQRALLRVNAAEEAAQVIIFRLKDPKLRRQALLDVQTYVRPAEPPPLEEDEARWQRILERPEVAAAIESVGRREWVPLPPP